MEPSSLSLRKCAIVFYQIMTYLKGVSGMKLHRDLGIAQSLTSHLGHRIRKAKSGSDPAFFGPVEANETYIGGKQRNQSEFRKLRFRRGRVGKTAVVGAKDGEREVA